MNKLTQPFKLIFFTLITLWLAQPFVAHAMPKEPIAVNNIVYEISQIQREPLANGKVAITIHATGTGIIDCLDNQACLATARHGDETQFQQTLQFVLDKGTGKLSGRIVIDVISAGFTGNVKGTATALGNDGWQLALQASSNTSGGGKFALSLSGIFDDATGSLINLIGQGIVSTSDMDMI